MMVKRFKLGASQLRRVAAGHGGCFASDRITVHGEPVGYMVREASEDPQLSGWTFLAGTETDEEMEDPLCFEIYDVNTIANYDPDIIPFLGAPVGSAFERRNNAGPLVPYAP